MISIIIPTLHQWDYYEKIITNIKNVCSLDYEIITIENKLVNEAWNEWVEQAKGDYILIINDDIVIPKWVIEWMIEVLKDKKVACPIFTRSDDPKIYYNNNWNIVGFCYMIKSSDKDLCFPIPKELQLRYGDNYIYNKMSKSVWYVDIPIHHRESKTILSDEMFMKCKEICKKDKIEWMKIEKGFN